MLMKQKEDREMSEVQKKPKISVKSSKMIEKKRFLTRNAFKSNHNVLEIVGKQESIEEN